VIADLLRAGGRDEEYEAREELVRLEHDLGRAVAPAMAQAVEKPAIGRWQHRHVEILNYLVLG